MTYGIGAHAWFGVGPVVVMLVALVLWLVTLVSVVQSSQWTPGLKALWVLASASNPLVGLVCWLGWGRHGGNVVYAPPEPPSSTTQD